MTCATSSDHRNWFDQSKKDRQARSFLFEGLRLPQVHLGKWGPLHSRRTPCNCVLCKAQGTSRKVRVLSEKVNAVWRVAAAICLWGTAHMATAASTHPLFVLNSLDATVSVIDPQTWAERERIPVGKEPHHLYLTPDERELIVANAAGDSLTILDPRTGKFVRNITGILDPYHLRFSPDMKWFVIAGNRLNHVDIYRWENNQPLLSKRIATAKTPSHLWIDSKSARAYATMQDSDEFIAIDLATQTVLWRAATGSMPADIYGSADDKHVFIGLTGSDSVQVFDITGNTPKEVTQLKTGKGAHAFRATGDKRHLLVSNRVANTISKIDMQAVQVVDTFNAPGGPDCMDLSPDGRYIYLSSRWARYLTVIDTQSRQVVRQVRVGRSPHGVWTLDHAPR